MLDRFCLAEPRQQAVLDLLDPLAELHRSSVIGAQASAVTVPVEAALGVKRIRGLPPEGSTTEEKGRVAHRAREDAS
jgi:hypothetical protein